MSTQESIREDRKKILSILSRRKKTDSISYDDLESRTRGRVDDLDFALWSLARSGDVVFQKGRNNCVARVVLVRRIMQSV